MSNNIAAQKKELRRVIRDANKELKELSREDKVAAEIKKWEESYNLKQELEALCKERGTTLKKVMAEKDYYNYAQLKGSKKALDTSADWVQDTIKRGVSEADLLRRANDLKRKYVLSKKKKKKGSKSSQEKTIIPAVPTMG